MIHNKSSKHYDGGGRKCVVSERIVGWNSRDSVVGQSPGRPSLSANLKCLEPSTFHSQTFPAYTGTCPHSAPGTQTSI